MTDKRRLEIVKLLLAMFDQCPPTDGIFTPQELVDIEVVLQSFRDELEPKTFRVGEKVDYKFYDGWVRATVEKIGKVRVGIQIKDFPAEIKYVSAKMLKKVEAK